MWCHRRGDEEGGRGESDSCPRARTPRCAGGRAHDDRAGFRVKAAGRRKKLGFRGTAPSVEHIALNSPLTSRSGFGMPLEAVQIWDSSDPYSATTMTCITCCRS